MRIRMSAVFVAALLLAWPAAAQEQRGSIEGVITDASGAVLPGVTVEASTATGVVLSTVTDGSGVYRFPSLAPATYKVTASLSGFQSRAVEEVLIRLGQIKKVDFSLTVAGVAETVEVTAQSPLVDVRQAARQTNIRSEQFDLLPKGRDFTTLVTQAAGANSEPKLGGLSIDGASAGENRFLVDGVETTNLKTGLSGTSVIADFVEEVQIKSSGYTAEYGGAVGGVINVLTKSGTNELRGTAGFQFQGSALEGERRPTLRQNLTDPLVAEYITYPKDDERRIEPAIAIGGPIIRNRAWFFGAYQPALTTTERTVNAESAVNPSARPGNEDQKEQQQYVTANITSQLSDALRSRVAFNHSWRRSEGLLPALTGTDLPDTNYAKTSTFPNWLISGNADWVASPRFFVGFHAGYRTQDQYDSNVTEQTRFTFSTNNNLDIPGVPANLRQSTGFSSLPTNVKVDRDQFTRAYVKADGTVYGELGGGHQVKFGVQFDRTGNNVLSGESSNWVRIHWNAALSTGRPVQRGTYGYYQVRSNGVDQDKGFITEGNIHSNIVQLFIQDAWTIRDRLTINAGVRTERERVPTYSTAEGIPEFGLEFSFADKLAPRLGAAYDINGDGRWKLFGSWGIFYDFFKLELPRGSFGGDKWLEYYYTLDTFDWTSLDPAGCPPACPGTIIRGAPTSTNPLGGIDFRHPSFGSDAIDPDLKPMRMQEATAGLEHQLNDQVALSVRYVHKQLDRAVEDTGALDAEGNEIYVIANPGFGLTSVAHPGVPYPKAVRDYDSVEFAVDKRFADNWYFRGSYLWSRLWGNYTGLSQSDENGRTSPNIGRVFDYPLMMFQDGGTPVYGNLPTDRPHQFKAQFIYQFPIGTSIGLNQFVGSGLPVTREIGIYPGSNLPVQYLGRGNEGRTPTLSQTDLLIQHQFDLGDRGFGVFLNVLNLFNQDTAISRHSTYHYPNGVIPNEDAFYSGQQRLADLIVSQGVTQHPLFLKDNSFQAPIQARFGVKFEF
jgi:hypothetical protein